jgi:hypothetical protein
MIAFCSPSLWAVNCVRIMQDTNVEPLQALAPSVNTTASSVDVTAAISEDVTTPTSVDNSMAVTTGQIYASPGIDEATQMVKIMFERKTYKVDPNFAKSIKLKGCFVQPICLIAKVDSIAMKNLADASEHVINFHRGDKFQTIATKTTEKNERVFLISADKDYYWVANKDVITYTNKTCEEIKDVAPPKFEGAVVNPRSGKYVFGFEVGMGSGYKSDYYSPFITDVPDPSNVGPLSNPVVTEVKKGKSLFLGPLMELNFSDSFKVKLGAQYQENTYTYIGKDNPTIAANTLDSLPDVEGQIKNQSLVFSVAPALEFGSANHRLGLGVNLRTQYYISKPASITYRVGTVFKANEMTIEAGPKGFDSIVLGSLYYQWYPSDGPFALRLTIETDGNVLNAGLSAFY